MDHILILGSAPDAIAAREWPTGQFDSIVAINNAWKIRSDWTHNIFPTDFPPLNRPSQSSHQSLISADEYVPAQNLYGGFVYAGGTMALTAAYWTLAVLKPKHLFFLGCDMVYGNGKTHFYGTGTADPLRKDISLRSLEAKSARFECFASMAGCTVHNLSEAEESRLVYRRKKLKNQDKVLKDVPRKVNSNKINKALKMETELSYFILDGKYWKHEDTFDTKQIDELDKLWLTCLVT